MPTSIDPPLADDEIECARCGARIHIESTRCPNCGVNLYEPDDEETSRPGPGPSRKGVGARLEDLFRRAFHKPYAADELFGAAINQAELFNDLLRKVGGDRAAAERLIEFEKQQNPTGIRTTWLASAIQRWERDNRSPGTKTEGNG